MPVERIVLSDMITKAVLDEPFDDTIRFAPTVRQFIGRCLSQFLGDGEGFNGKRPLGNSGWQAALADHYGKIIPDYDHGNFELYNDALIGYILYGVGDSSLI